MGGACHRTSGAVAGRTIGGTKDGTASSAVKRSDEESEVPLIVDKSGRNGDMSDDKFRNVRRLCSGRVISDEIYGNSIFVGFENKFNFEFVWILRGFLTF